MPENNRKRLSLPNKEKRSRKRKIVGHEAKFQEWKDSGEKLLASIDGKREFLRIVDFDKFSITAKVYGTRDAKGYLVHVIFKHSISWIGALDSWSVEEDD